LKSEVLDNWDDIGERLQRIYEDLNPEKAKKSRKDRASSSPRKTSAPPKKQMPKMRLFRTIRG
jgi:hypothetical protein